MRAYSKTDQDQRSTGILYFPSKERKQLKLPFWILSFLNFTLNISDDIAMEAVSWRTGEYQSRLLASSQITEIVCVIISFILAEWLPTVSPPPPPRPQVPLPSPGQSVNLHPLKSLLIFITVGSFQLAITGRSPPNASWVLFFLMVDAATIVRSVKQLSVPLVFKWR